MARDIEIERKFYQRIAEILGVPDNYKSFPYQKKTRWNNRTAGNGRFEGYGLIRMFGPNCIHVALINPIKVNKIFCSPEEVYDFLFGVI